MSTVGAMLPAFPMQDAMLYFAGISRKDKYAKLMNLGLVPASLTTLSKIRQYGVPGLVGPVPAAGRTPSEQGAQPSAEREARKAVWKSAETVLRVRISLHTRFRRFDADRACDIVKLTMFDRGHTQ